jgi:hypothetical protein
MALRVTSLAVKDVSGMCVLLVYLGRLPPRAGPPSPGVSVSLFVDAPGSVAGSCGLTGGGLGSNKSQYLHIQSLKKGSRCRWSLVDKSQSVS